MKKVEKPCLTNEKLPDIYSSKSNTNQMISKQSIADRNKIIDDYIKHLDQKNKNKNDISVSSEEDEKDPFSSKAMKNLKILKKPKNNLILPNFKRREKLKSESGSRNNNVSIPKQKTFNENSVKKNKRMPKNKNNSENNIMNKYIKGKKIYKGQLLNMNGVNNNLNSKWTTNPSTFNNYINYIKNNKNKNIDKFSNKNGFKINHINNTLNNTLFQFKGRSKSHIKQSYNLYKDKINYINNKTINEYNNNIKGKYANTQIEIIPYNNAGTNNLYNYTYKIERSKKRNYTAKIIKNKITIKENAKQNKKIKNIRINSTLSNQRIIENKHKIYEKLIKEKNNPYGLHWVNKILQKNKEEKLGISKDFINGVPIIKLIGKGNMTKREIKKRLSEIEQRKKMEENKYNKIINAEAKLNKENLDEEYNIPNDILQQFNKNTKNFFKFRKDIIEQPEEENQPLEQ